MSVNRTSERGDTLIEVLVAITVLAVVLVGTFSVMNRGVAQMYDDMERSEVRLLVEEQIESLTYARDQYLLKQQHTPLATYDSAIASLWESDVKNQLNTGSVPNLNECTNTSNAFYIEKQASGTLLLKQYSSPTGEAGGFPAPGDGIWIQKISSSPLLPVAYKDFYVRACWRQNTSPVVQVVSSVVRLYDE